MRRRGRRTSGVSLGTIAALTLIGLVIAGCVLLFPKLIGHIELRVDPQKIGVAIDSSIAGWGSQSDQASNVAVQATPATAPPMDMSTLAPTATQTAAQHLTLTAGGSIKVDTIIQKACTGEQGYSFGPVFEQLAPCLTSDINLATLENLVVVNEKLTDVNMPGDALTALRQCGFSTLCNGFYNVLNNGVSGLDQTQQAILQNGMTPYGAYTSEERRDHVVTMAVGDTTVAMLSFQGELSSASKKKTTKAEQAFAIAPLTLPVIEAGITAARAAGAQIVIVSLCWGKVGAGAPSNSQKELAQGIAEAGADIILGTHSGVVQPIELLTSTRADGSTRQTLCAYSLGNLLESDRSQRDEISAVLLHIGMTYDLAADSLTFDTLEYTPTYVWRGKIDGVNSYAILLSNADPPSFVEKDQRSVMQRALSLVEKALEGSPVVERH